MMLTLGSKDGNCIREIHRAPQSFAIGPKTQIAHSMLTLSCTPSLLSYTNFTLPEIHPTPEGTLGPLTVGPVLGDEFGIKFTKGASLCSREGTEPTQEAYEPLHQQQCFQHCDSGLLCYCHVRDGSHRLVSTTNQPSKCPIAPLFAITLSTRLQASIPSVSMISQQNT